MQKKFSLKINVQIVDEKSLSVPKDKRKVILLK